MIRRLLALLLLLPTLAWATPSISNGAIVASTGSTNVSNSAATFFAMVGIAGTDSTLTGTGSSLVTMWSHSATVSWTARNMYCFVGTNPGTGKSYTINPTSNAVTFFNQTCTISDAATSCSDTAHTTVLGAGSSVFAFKTTPSGTPTATTASCYLEYSIP